MQPTLSILRYKILLNVNIQLLENGNEKIINLNDGVIITSLCGSS
jgi:hypothetical protein